MPGLTARSPWRLACLGSTFVVALHSSTIAFAEDAAIPAKKPPLGVESMTVTGTAEAAYTVTETASATKLSLSLRETPQSMTVMTRQRLDDQNLQTLRQVLDETPGVYSYAYDSERVLFTSRGFVVDSLLYDGVPATTNFSTDSLDETLDTALYERIEIVRGASGLMTGAGSPAASINLVRKHADAKILTGNLEVTGGSWEDYRAEGDISMPLTTDGRVRARVVGVFQDRESYQDFYQNQRGVFYGVIDADLTPSTRASLGFDYQSNEPSANTWGSFPLFLADGTEADWPRSVTTAPKWTFWDRTKKTAFAEIEHDFANGWLFRGTLSWRQFKEDLALFYVYGFPDPTTGLGLDPYTYRSDGDISEKALDAYARGPIALFGRQHELVLGFNGSRVQNDGDEFGAGPLDPVGNFFEWDGSYREPSFADQGILLNDIHTRQNGFYTAGRFSLMDPLTLIVGTRFASWKINTFYLYDSPTITFKYDYEEIIPYAGLIYDFSHDFSAFVSYTEIFKPQNNRDLGGGYLDPIDGNSIEGGIKGEHFGGRLNTAITLFETRQNNVATPYFDPVSGAPVMLPDGTQATQPTDGTKTRGVEVEASGALLPGWNASVGLTHYSLKDVEGDAVRTFIPRTLLRTFTTWTPSGMFDRLTIGGGINWQSTSRTFVGSPSGGTIFPQDSVTFVNLMLRYRVTSNVSAQFNANNLLDNKYFVLDEFDNTYYGPPASFFGSVNLRF